MEDFVDLCCTIEISLACDEQQPDRTSELNFVHSVLASVPGDTLLISVDICVGELIGKLGFLQPHGTFRVISDIC